MKIETTIKRLELLRDYMMTVKPDTFDFTHWWEEDILTTCGFTACALGHACYVPQLKRLGLRLSRSNGEYYRNVILKRKGKWIADDTDAAMKVFGISSRLANQLFTPDVPGSPSRDITPKQWARHATKIIDRLKKKHGIKPRPRSSPLARKPIRAVLLGLPEILHSPVDGRPGVTPSISVPSDQFACSEPLPSSG